MCDMKAGFDWLAARPDVDAERIGIIGAAAKDAWSRIDAFFSQKPKGAEAFGARR